MILTKEMLQQLGACADGIEWCERNKLFGLDLSLLPKQPTKDPLGYIQWLTSKTVGYVFNDKFQPLSFTNERGKTMFWKYDNRGNKIEFISSTGSTQRWTYDDNNNILTYDDDLGFKNVYAYDEHSNRVSKGVCSPNHPDWTLFAFEYNDNHQLIRTTGEMYVISCEYDVNGNLVYRAYFDATGTHLTTWERWEYNKDGNLTKHWLSSGEWQYRKYDEEGRIVEIKDSSGQDCVTTYQTSFEPIPPPQIEGSIRQFLVGPSGQLLPLRQFEDGEVVDRYVYDDHFNCIEHESWGDSSYSLCEYWPNGQLKQWVGIDIPLIDNSL
jgi:YD repeat-containing protein